MNIPGYKLTLNNLLRMTGLIMHNGSKYHTFNLSTNFYVWTPGLAPRKNITRIKITHIGNERIQFHPFSSF